MIKQLVNTAKDARKVIMEFLEQHHKAAGAIVKMGADGTPTSRADLIAETSIFELVINKDLPINILSEEFGFLDRGYEKTLILDPLDGSYNAEHNIPYFAISMAVGKDSLRSVTEAVVMNLVSGTVYWAQKNKGAFREDKRLKVRKFSDEPLFVANLGWQVSSEVSNIIKTARRVRALGCASLEMIMVAEGVADIFIYDSYPVQVLRIIDIAGSSLIVREAGGEVFDGLGNVFDMDFDLKKRKNAVAVGDVSYFKSLDLFYKRNIK